MCVICVITGLPRTIMDLYTYTSRSTFQNLTQDNGKNGKAEVNNAGVTMGKKREYVCGRGPIELGKK